MESQREVHPDFMFYLRHKEQKLIDLYLDLRELILEIHPKSNELLYHTHALTSLHTLSEKMSDAFCMIPIYTSHLNLGFNKGTLLEDPQQLLQGTGKLIRHIPIEIPSDYRNDKVEKLIKSAIKFAENDSEIQGNHMGITISKIKRST